MLNMSASSLYPLSSLVNQAMLSMSASSLYPLSSLVNPGNAEYVC